MICSIQLVIFEREDSNMVKCTESFIQMRVSMSQMT